MMMRMMMMIEDGMLKHVGRNEEKEHENRRAQSNTIAKKSTLFKHPKAILGK